MSAKYLRRIRGNGDKPRDLFFWIRNILNIIFMVGAVVGVIFYFFTEQETLGIIIILTAMSVSYTHLDVYKRQAQECGFVFGWHWLHPTPNKH